MKKAPYVLAIDIGTSSSRAAVYDASGDRLPATTFQIAYPLQSGVDGRAELRSADVAGAVDRVVAQALAAFAKEGGEAIAAVGVSCFWHSLLGLDAKGLPATPIFTWADSRCRAEAAQLREKGAERAIHARTGCMARASFWPAKLLWLRRAQPALLRKVSRWVSPAEWIQERWCGQASASLSMASGTGLLDDSRTAPGWDTALLRRCGLVASRLNPLSDDPAPLSPTMRRKFPALRDAMWYPAIGDGAASNLGSGATVGGLTAINVGTSAALRVVVPAAKKGKTPFGLFRYRIDAKRRLLGGAVSNAGNLRAWALRELKLPDDPAVIETALRARPLPAAGLTVLPFWTAERAPTWPEDLSSAVLGMTQATTALDLLQALQEGTYHRLATIAAAVEKAVGHPLTVVVSGGILHSADSLQRLADCLGRPVHASPEPEASLRGGAVFALERIGASPATPKLGKPVRPRAAAARAQAAARARQEELETFLNGWKGARLSLYSRTS
jgi:gluconokinase